MLAISPVVFKKFETESRPDFFLLFFSERELNDFFLDWDSRAEGSTAGSADGLLAAAISVRDCGLACGLIQRVRKGEERPQRGHYSHDSYPSSDKLRISE